MRHILIFFLLSVLSIGGAIAQKKERHFGITHHDEYVQFKKAKNLINQHSYYNAIDILEELTQNLDSIEHVNYTLGNTYFVARDYQNAETWLKKVAEVQEKEAQYPNSLFDYARALQMNGKYDQAKVWYYKYIRLRNKDNLTKFNKKNARQLLRSCDYALEELKHDSAFVSVKHLEGDVNHGYTDFSPIAVDDETLIFASLRSDSILEYDYESETFFPVKLYQSKKQDDELWGEPSELEFANHPYEHTANGVFTRDKESFFFSRCYQDTHNEVICALYVSKKEGDNWTKPQKLPSKINKHGYTNTQPTIGYAKVKKGRKRVLAPVLYFVSNRPGGQGGLDIWYSTIIDDQYDNPQNCGRINTAMDEVSPFYDLSEQKLYFSSNYHLGFGGLDVFSARGYTRRWKDIKNLHFPINSSYDDTYYVPNKDSSNLKQTHGYLVSNRPGGIALKSPTCCDDIYSFEYFTPDYIDINHLVYKDSTYIDSVLVTRIDSITQDTTQFYTPKTKTTRIAFTDAKVGLVKQRYIDDITSTDYSTYKDYIQWEDSANIDQSFTTQLIQGKEYALILDKEGYEPQVIDLNPIATKHSGTALINQIELIEKQEVDSTALASTQAPTDEKELEKLSLDIDKKELKSGKVLVLDNLYFDTDKDIVQQTSVPTLYLLLTFLEENPKISVEIGGHTDSDATNAYNLDLSQRRANTVMKFLIGEGIAEKRLKAVGYGEEKPVATNQTAEGKQKNRRTEITIL